VRHEDEKVEEVWKYIKKKYLDRLDELDSELTGDELDLYEQSEGLSEEETEKAVSKMKSNGPTRRKIDEVGKNLERELHGLEHRYGKAFMKKLDRKRASNIIAQLER
jgi:hypothetical protein